MTAHMNSRSGDRVPAGVSGQAGRGTVGTTAPTTPVSPIDFTQPMFSPVLWVASAAYTAISLVLVWLALTLGSWWLMLLIPAMGTLAAAALLGVLAFGISRIEADPA